MKAKLVFDGIQVSIPEGMGKPRGDQMQGTAAEQLSELAGRICYDSLGNGRNSGDYHKHIVEVGHGSVLEHFNVTVKIPIPMSDFYPWMINRPGVWIRPCSTVITLNLRSLLEWDRMGNSPDILTNSINVLGATLAPQIIAPNKDGQIFQMIHQVRLEHDEEKWVSLYLSGSRGFSHEMVRHGDWTAISQRSTRYCDESLSEWVTHPLLKQYLNEECVPIVETAIDDLIADSRTLYCTIVNRLETFLRDRGETPANARKQSRGAARGFLGNALETEMIFSANVAQWKRILRQRGGPAADAEIRAIACLILGELKSSQYSDCFVNFDLLDSDFGPCVVETV